MGHIRVLICHVDDPASDQMTQLAAFDLPPSDIAVLQPETTLDELETTTLETGNAILRRLLQAQWETLDMTLAHQYLQRLCPETITFDGYEPITVASRFGTMELMRQVCLHPATHQHVLPANAVLPPHHGMIITRGLQEWACLRPQELPFASVGRLLDWQHLREKCVEMASRICRGREAKRRLLQLLYRRLWSGKVTGAVEVLRAYRLPARNEEALDVLIAYLEARAAWIPNYRQRRIERKYIGSGHVEKANDMLVARRQKGRGCIGAKQRACSGGAAHVDAERRVGTLLAGA